MGVDRRSDIGLCQGGGGESRVGERGAAGLVGVCVCGDGGRYDGSGGIYHCVVEEADALTAASTVGAQQHAKL